MRFIASTMLDYIKFLLRTKLKYSVDLSQTVKTEILKYGSWFLYIINLNIFRDIKENSSFCIFLDFFVKTELTFHNV